MTALRTTMLGATPSGFLGGFRVLAVIILVSSYFPIIPLLQVGGFS